MIGVFDSGFGGLHVLRGLIRDMPEYDYVYLGDSARAPYGPHSHEKIYEWTKQGVEFLFSQGARIVILACNTASSEALRRLQSDYANESQKKVLGVLIPFAEAAVAATRNRRVGIVATEGTVYSAAFMREIQKIDPTIAVFQQACPLLVPMIEAGDCGSEEMREKVGSYLEPLLQEDIDTLVLGCTHYGLVQDVFRNECGEGTVLISERDVLSSRLADYFKRHPEYRPLAREAGSVRFFTTGDVRHFNELGSVFSGREIRAEHAALS